MTYTVWTQWWTLEDLREVDREKRKIISMNGSKHPLSSKAVLYLPRADGGRGLKSVEQDYKLIKIKEAIKFYESQDPIIRSVRAFEDWSAEKGHSSLVKDATRYAQELGTILRLESPEPSCSLDDYALEACTGHHVKLHLKKAKEGKLKEKIRDQKWQGSLLTKRWEDEKLDKKGCLTWLNE